MRRMFVVEDESGMLDLLGPSVAGDEPYAWSKWTRIWPIDLDEELTSKPEPTSEHCYQHHERRSVVHAEFAAAFAKLVALDPPPLTWTCSVCAAEHPPDHAGIFCGVCKAMAACCSCEREFRGQCHGFIGEPLAALSHARDLLVEVLAQRRPWSVPKSDKELQQNAAHARGRQAVAALNRAIAVVEASSAYVNALCAARNRGALISTVVDFQERGPYERCDGGWPGGVHRYTEGGREVLCPVCGGSGWSRKR